MSRDTGGDRSGDGSWDDEAARNGEEMWDDAARPDDVGVRASTADRGSGRRRGETGEREPRDGESDHWVDTLREQQYDRRPTEPRRPETMDPRVFDAGVATFSLKYPFSVGGSATLLTGVLGILWFLVLPGILAAGYLVRLAGSAARAEEPPGYDDLWGLARCGLVASVLWWGALVGGGALVYVAASESVLLASVLTLGGAYLLPGLFTTYAATESLREAAARTPEFAFTRLYAGHFVVTAVVLFGVTVAGFVALFLVTFAVLLVPLLCVIPAAYWGYLYGQAIDEGRVAPLPADRG